VGALAAWAQWPVAMTGTAAAWLVNVSAGSMQEANSDNVCAGGPLEAR